MQQWNTWNDLWGFMLAGNYTVRLKDCSVKRARDEWEKFRREDLIKTSRFDVELSQNEEKECTITLKCACCNRKL